MFCENSYPNIIIDADGDTLRDDDFGKVFEALAYGASVDFIDFTNDGDPEYLGNDYAQWRFLALNDGFSFTYRFGPNEMKQLASEGKITLTPYPYNELEEWQHIFPSDSNDYEDDWDYDNAA